MKNNWLKAEKVLIGDEVAVLPTDTLYGLVASALSKKAVKKIYEIKGRDDNKPLIVLISSFNDLKKFGIKVGNKQLDILKRIWPGKVSVEFCYKNKKFSYIRAGQNYNAFRMVGNKNKNLYKLINKVGPLVAPSANPQGSKPAETINDAKKYFGNKVSMYINIGRRNLKPSTLIRINGDEIEILRQGEAKIKE